MPKNKVFAVLALFMSTAGAVLAEGPVRQPRLSKVVVAAAVNSGAGKVGVSVIPLDGAVRTPLARFNDEIHLKPASVLKILLSGAALERLGPDFRFATEVWVDGFKNGRVERLTLRGFGDPTLTIESLWLVARRIRKAGVREIAALSIDSSAFLERKSRHGQRAYEAAPSALALNFNCLNVTVCPAGIGESAFVTVDPWESGVKIGGGALTGGKAGAVLAVNESQAGLVVSGSIARDGGCKEIYRSVADTNSYVGGVFQELLAGVGVRVAGIPRLSRPEVLGRKLFTHHSKPLSQIIWDLNHYSTNFIAEQLVFALGEGGNGYYSYQGGLEAIKVYAQKTYRGGGEVAIVDGSGLSHSNRLSAALLTDVLAAIHRNPRIAPEFESSLSIAGQSGTLKSRSFRPPGVLVRAKTGTLSGVRSLAGFILARSGRRYAFSILQNDLKSAAAADRLEQVVIEAVYTDG